MRFRLVYGVAQLESVKVSIITVCFNSGEFISTAIESVLSQEYPEIEYIVVDGGSTDETLDVIDSYQGQITRVIHGPDQGIYDAMNKGVSAATGDIVGILNSDDFYVNNQVIGNVVKEFSDCPGAELLFGNVDFVSPPNLADPVRFYSSYQFKPWKLRFGFMPAHPAAFIRRSAYEQVGQYKLGYKIGADFEWFVRALQVNYLPFSKIDKTLVRMREGGISTSGFESYWLSSREQLRALRENNIRSNMLFVLSRLPVKFFYKWLYKGHR